MTHSYKRLPAYGPQDGPPLMLNRPFHPLVMPGWVQSCVHQKVKTRVKYFSFEYLALLLHFNSCQIVLWLLFMDGLSKIISKILAKQNLVYVPKEVQY